MADRLPTIWPLAGHTAAKHTILRKYLEAWLPIMGQRGNGRLVLIDGFAGPGVYAGGEPGSPIIMLNAFLNHSARERIRAELVYFFIEEDEERAAELERQVERLGTLPAQVSCRVFDTSYEKTFERLLDALEKRGGQLAPTFAFLDPFGYSDAPMSLTGRFLQFRGCEVLIYVPFPDINRFLTRAGQETALTSLFGGEEWREAIDMHGQERLQFLHSLFKRQLHEASRLEYVRSFQIVGQHAARGYHLFFGTNHKRGLHRMKDAMWSVDPARGECFQDSTDPNALVLFQPEVDTAPLRDALIEHFGTNVFRIEDALDFALVDTPYRPEHVKTKTLEPLEKKGQLEVVERGGAGKRGYPDGTRLRFRPS